MKSVTTFHPSESLLHRISRLHSLYTTAMILKVECVANFLMVNIIWYDALVVLTRSRCPHKTIEFVDGARNGIGGPRILTQLDVWCWTADDVWNYRWADSQAGVQMLSGGICAIVVLTRSMRPHKSIDIITLAVCYSLLLKTASWWRKDSSTSSGV